MEGNKTHDPDSILCAVGDGRLYLFAINIFQIVQSECVLFKIRWQRKDILDDFKIQLVNINFSPDGG